VNSTNLLQRTCVWASIITTPDQQWMARSNILVVHSTTQCSHTASVSLADLEARQGLASNKQFSTVVSCLDVVLPMEPMQ